MRQVNASFHTKQLALTTWVSKTVLCKVNRCSLTHPKVSVASCLDRGFGTHFRKSYFFPLNGTLISIL